jgi:spore maturation protein CgeB
LVVGEFVEGAIGVSYVRAFRTLGHEVFSFDSTEELLRLSPLARNRYTRYVGRSAFALVMNLKLLSAAVRVRPNLVFVLKGPYVAPWALKRIRSRIGANLVNLNPDNPLYPDFTTRYIRRTIPLYDCYFTFLRDIILKLRAAGSPRVEYLPFAYDPEIHQPVDSSEDERSRWGHDVVFVGAWDQEREAWLEPLADFDLGIWGYQWTKLDPRSPLRRRVCGEGMFGLAMARILSASKIVLNNLRPQGINGHNMRTFEVPACGAFELTQRSAGQIEFFAEGREIECYANTTELREKVAAYLADEHARRRIAEAGHEAVRPHTYLERAAKLIEVVRELRLGSVATPRQPRPRLVPILVSLPRQPVSDVRTHAARVLFLNPPAPGSYQFTLARGLEHLGWEVHWVSLWSPRNRTLARATMRIRQRFPWLSDRAILPVASKFDGDILIVVKGTQISPRLLAHLIRMGKRVVNVYPDSAGRLLYPADRATLTLWSLITLKDRQAVDTLRSSGLTNVRYLPQCFDVDVPYELPDIRVPEGPTFVAHLDPDRAAWVEPLCEAEVKIYGLPNGMRVFREAEPVLYEKFRRCHKGGSVSELEKLAFYARSDISINIHRPDELFGVNKRTFDICGMGGCQIVDYRPTLSEYFVPGREVIAIERPGELPERVREMMGRWDLRREIAEAGKARAHRDHRNDIRAAELLNLIAEIR